MKLKIIVSASLLLFGEVTSLRAQTIAEKKASLTGPTKKDEGFKAEDLRDVNEALRQKRQELRELYATAWDLLEGCAPDTDYQQLLREIGQLRCGIRNIQAQWRQDSTLVDDDEYALWQQTETTLEQLVIDYGSEDFVYLIPPEIADKKLSVSSNLPIPRESWNEMLTRILEQNGIGIKQLNPFLRQLVSASDAGSGLDFVTDDRESLALLPPPQRIAFVLRPVATDIQRLYSFMRRFADEQRIGLQIVGREVWLVGSAGAIQEVLKLYDFAAAGHGDRDYRFVTLQKANAEEMAGILESIFGATRQTEGSAPIGRREGQRPPGGRPPTQRPPQQQPSKEPIAGLRVVTLSHAAHALFLLGSTAELDKAEEIIQEVEEQLSDASKKSVYWYTARHSDPEELAIVAERVYDLLTGVSFGQEGSDVLLDIDPNDPEPVNRGVPFYAGGLTIVDPGTVGPNLIDEEVTVTTRDNFIVDPKTNSIVMVVEAHLLPEIQEVLRRLDVPKKMVQIEVLLFEKRLTGRNRIGLNLLKMGSCASNVNEGCVLWNENGTKNNVTGVLEYTLSRMKGSWLPAYDLAFNFLISQDDIQINASPSVTTVNRTPALIAIVREISVNTGVVELDTVNSSRLADAFARQQYGITIKVTPTIHDCGDRTQDCDEESYITLETDVTFDTIDDPLGTNRPNVTRRHVANEVRVQDGETIILGGLRSKSLKDDHQAMPFLGDIPGVGKLFANTELSDETTEMFLFLTPRIIEDSHEALERMRCDAMRRRPGDSPELISCQLDAIDAEKRCMFEEGMKMLFGRPCDPHERVYWEYDGRGDCY